MRKLAPDANWLRREPHFRMSEGIRRAHQSMVFLKWTDIEPFLQGRAG
jgi:hypothetical protein